MNFFNLNKNERTIFKSMESVDESNITKNKKSTKDDIKEGANMDQNNKFNIGGILAEVGWKKMVEELFYSENNKVDEYFTDDTTVQYKWYMNEVEKIVVPKKIDLYTGLDITVKDQIYVQIKMKNFFPEVLLVNGDDRAVGIFRLKTMLIDGDYKNVLIANKNCINFNNHNSTKYFFIFADVSNKLYKIPTDISLNETEITNVHLCIDFGTSNTTAGCFLNDTYVNNISNIAIINKNVVLNSTNIVKFPEHDKEKESSSIEKLFYHNIVPTIVYVNDCSDPKNIDYSFGYEAAEKIKDDKYCPKASCFMEIKRWTSSADLTENIQDVHGNKATVRRRDIISKYIMFIIRNAENQFKCKFKNIHISAPVKLKDKVLGLYSDILQEQGYCLEIDNAIDEGIAVLYSIIHSQIIDKEYCGNKEEKALIIDCGGGTSDLASCRYKLEKDEDGIINLDIVTEYMNGDVNFGGNNLTYRIMQFMKIVYSKMYNDDKRLSIDEIISQDVNSMFSFIEGDVENDTDDNIKKRYEEVYKPLEESYKIAENIIPTKYEEYENQPKDIYDKVKNNFYFLWKLSEEMKKEFYRSTSISRYSFDKDSEGSKDIDLHINRIDSWRLSTKGNDGIWREQKYPDIVFTAKEIDKLLRADIYYLVRRFLNGLYVDESLNTYSQIRLSGQSSKINIFMESLKEFLPGKKIKSGRIHSKNNDSEELKLLCLKGAMMYMHALEKSNIEVNLKNETKNIPISVYIKNENDEYKEMLKKGYDWQQLATRRRITAFGKEIYLYIKNSDKDTGIPYKYVYEGIEYKKTNLDELEKISEARITQEDTDKLPADKKYIYVFLNKKKWGFDIMPIYRDGEGTLYRGDKEFCPFEMDILQETFFDGRK